GLGRSFSAVNPVGPHTCRHGSTMHNKGLRVIQMPTLKNSRHELFAQEIAKGRSQREAYRAAGYLTKSDDATDANASRLLSNAKVANRIRELQTEAANSTEVTVSSLIAEAERARALAEGKGQANAMVGAITLKARLAGLLVDRTEDMVRRDELEEQRVRRKATLAAISAGEMLAQAAESLGLPSTATAKAIALAASKLPYPPPSVQRLLYAARVREEKNDVR
ncbi:MAG: terminase small subunit, partial [Pseudolabrys sp.]